MIYQKQGIKLKALKKKIFRIIANERDVKRKFHDD